jgi:hypothetical protein
MKAGMSKGDNMAMISGVNLMEPRPCWVNGRKGMFHKWVEKEDVVIKSTIHLKTDVLKSIHDEYVLNGVIPNYCIAEKIHNTYALIEFEDGHIEHIPPTTITFLDNSEFYKYDWSDGACAICLYCNTDVLDEPCFSCIYGRGSENRFEADNPRK